MFDKMVRLGWPEPDQTKHADHIGIIKDIIAELSKETEEDAEARREKAKWDGFKPANERRPADEFADISSVKAEYTPVDISPEGDGSFLKYTIRESTSKFNRLIEEQDIVQYLHETRYDNGQLVDFDEKRKAKEKFEMGNADQHEHVRKAFKTMKKGEIVWLEIGP
jgi:hypothetical protein